jgi:hypothetical protein
MRTFWAVAINLVVLVQTAAGQSLGDLARQERARKAKEQKSTVEITNDELAGGKLDASPPLDAARKGDLDYLLRRLTRPRVTPELLAAFVPLKTNAIPKLLTLLGSAEAMKRVAPATVLMVLGNSEGLGSMARLLNDSAEVAVGAPSGSAPTDTAFDQQIQSSRVAGYALEATKLGFWRFTEGSTMTPDQVIQRLQKGPAIEIVGGVDNGQRLFNRALRDKDPNLRLAAIALLRVASGGKDFGFQPDQSSDQNESAIQQITTFLTTERAKVISSLLGNKPK